MIYLRAMRPRAIRPLATLVGLAVCSAIFPVGCGESASQQSSIPADFAAKLETEHPELFEKKTGKNKTEKLGGRDKRAIIREEWQKSQQ